MFIKYVEVFKSTLSLLAGSEERYGWFGWAVPLFCAILGIMWLAILDDGKPMKLEDVFDPPDEPYHPHFPYRSFVTRRVCKAS